MLQCFQRSKGKGKQSNRVKALSPPEMEIKFPGFFQAYLPCSNDSSKSNEIPRAKFLVNTAPANYLRFSDVAAPGALVPRTI